MRLQDGRHRGRGPVGRTSGQRSQDRLHGSQAPPGRRGPGGSDAWSELGSAARSLGDGALRLPDAHPDTGLSSCFMLNCAPKFTC